MKMIEQFHSKPLPYTMGNAGDLIKHGLLCEVFNWWPVKEKSRITFYDPFGGRPWQAPIHPEVSKRLSNLQSCPLKSAQCDATRRYFGSGHIIKNLSDITGKKSQLYVSDREPEVRLDLNKSGLSLIELASFNPGSAYSILDCQQVKESDSLILIDPFYDLKYINDIVLNKINKLVSEYSVAVILYVLHLNEDAELWRDFKRQNNNILNDNIRFYSLSCPAIINSPMSGEGKYHSSVYLYLNSTLIPK